MIIQNRASVDALTENVHAHAKRHHLSRPDILSLHSHSSPSCKRDIILAASDEEKKRKIRKVPVSQKGDLADIIIMTSSGTRGISFPNASKIICVIPTFSLENNFMEFLQGIYRGRGGGKGNRLDREIEIIIPQVLVLPPSGSTEATEASQIANLFATEMIMRMSILTRIFGAADLFGKPVSCIPLSGNLVEGAAQTIMDTTDSAIRSLEHAQQRDPANPDLWYVKENVREVFKNETTILRSHTDQGVTLVSNAYRDRLLRQFVQDANRGFDEIAQGDYIPEGCYTVGELILQNLDGLGLKEQNTHFIEIHEEEPHQRLITLCAKLRRLAMDKEMAKGEGVRDPANALLSIMTVLAQTRRRAMSKAGPTARI